MIISHTHKYIFIKSAKTAGTSIEAALSAFCKGDDVVTPLGDYDFNRNEKGEWIHKSMNAEGFEQHEWGTAIREKVGPETWNEYYKFSIARNPWDRVVSLYEWFARKNPDPKLGKRFLHRIGMPFDETTELRKLFGKWVNDGDWQTNDRFYVVDDELCVDFMIRYENLQEDFAAVTRRVGLPNIVIPRLKTGIRPGRIHYSQYYNDASRHEVGERHKNDLRFFGYEFEEL